MLGGMGGFAGRALVIKFIVDTSKALYGIKHLKKEIQDVNNATISPMRGGRTRMGGGEDYINAYRGKVLSGGEQYLQKYAEAAMVSTTKEFAQLDAGATRANYSLSGLLNTIMNLPAPIKAAILVIGALAYSFYKMIQFGTKVEQQIMMLEVLTGSEAMAHRTMQQALRFSLLTPFSPTQVFAATTAAATYGIDMYRKGAYNLPRNVDTATILAGMGAMPDIHGQPLGIERASHALFRGDLRLLRPYRGLMQRTMDPGTGMDIYAAAKATGPVGSPAFIEKLIEGFGRIRAITEMARRQSETVVGLWSTIKGFMEEFWIRMSGAAEQRGVITFWSQLREILLSIRDAGIQIMDYLYPFLVEFGAFLIMPFKAIWDIIRIIWQFFEPVLLPVLKIAIGLVRILFMTAGFIVRLTVRFFQAIFDLMSVFTGMFGKITGFNNYLNGIVNYMNNIIIYLQMVFQLSYAYIDSLLGSITTTIRGFTNSIGNFFSTLDNNISAIWEKHKHKLRILAALGTVGLTEIIPLGSRIGGRLSERFYGYAQTEEGAIAAMEANRTSDMMRYAVGNFFSTLVDSIGNTAGRVRSGVGGAIGGSTTDRIGEFLNRAGRGLGVLDAPVTVINNNQRYINNATIKVKRSPDNSGAPRPNRSTIPIDIGE